MKRLSLETQRLIEVAIVARVSGDEHGRREAGWGEVTDLDALVDLVGEPSDRARNKSRSSLLDVDRDWLAASGFCVLSNAAADGSCDTSPKGDPAGQLLPVLDEHTVEPDERSLGELEAYYGPAYAANLNR